MKNKIKVKKNNSKSSLHTKKYKYKISEMILDIGHKQKLINIYLNKFI